MARRSTACITKSTPCPRSCTVAAAISSSCRRCSLKGETPVIYFYTKETQKVRVGVGFPAGNLDPVVPPGRRWCVPSLATQAEQSGELEGGRICWYAEVIPGWAMPQLTAASRVARRLK